MSWAAAEMNKYFSEDEHTKDICLDRSNLHLIPFVKKSQEIPATESPESNSITEFIGTFFTL